MRLEDTGVPVLMNHRSANPHALGRMYGFTVMPTQPLPLAVRWFINGVVSGFATRRIEQVLSSPLGCAWQFAADSPVEHRRATSADIQAELDRRLQDVTVPDQRFIFMSTAVTLVPVQLWYAPSGFTLALGGNQMGSPGFRPKVEAMLADLKELRFCADAKVQPDGVIRLERAGLPVDGMLIELCARLGAVVADYLRMPHRPQPMVAIWPVPDLGPTLEADPQPLQSVTAG